MKTSILILGVIFVSVVGIAGVLAARDGGDFIYHLASVVGVTAEVPANKYNTLSLQLNEKEKQLETREENIFVIENRLVERESKTARYVVVIGGMLLAALGLNFYLDYRFRHLRK